MEMDYIMANANKHDTKLTLAVLIAKKAQNSTRKMRTKDVYVESLDSVITLNEPSKELLYKFSDRFHDTSNNTEDRYMAMSYLISQSVDLFKDKSFYEEEGSPELSVHKLLSIEDISMIQEELNKLTSAKSINEEVKN